MSQFSSDQESKQVRIIINGQEVDPSQLSQNLFTINGQGVDPSNLPQNLITINTNGKGKRGSGGGGCWSCFGCLITIIIVGSILIGVLAAASAIFNFNIPYLDKIFEGLTGVTMPQSQALTTDPNNFDPFVGVAQARAFAGQDAELVSINAYYVRSDGTMDLNASYTPAPNTEYKFVRKVARPADAPPVGVSGSTNGQWYEPISIDAYRPGQRRHVSIMGGGTNVSYDYTNDGMLRETDDPTSTFSDTIVPDPKCTTEQLWSIALEYDAPVDAVATIEYDSDGYSFNISGAGVYLNFTADCKLVK